MYKIKFTDGSEREFESLAGADLRGADLTGADLERADLTNADLRGVDLRGANLHGANLKWADLTYANLTRANLEGADLTGAYLDYAAWPLWCGTAHSNIKIDNKLKAQLLYHAFIVTSPDCPDIPKEIKDFIKKYFHRYNEVEKLK